ncbi:Gfo/Idh/MocA family protein [Occultella gossypii]|uniref:Gfo/Idh/MocA family oxidoreductase n=1 Tax=Occultella gossypii TaxID=2800820 RepID=A0ABS7S4A5_9MICO|nr:Gfo/Idh/MocA family oxidoreductase [Occultella gossypii]MBZ2195184.1 Gfo/Idh/MocA family oxidoreductase [Occultella gossypii]
MPTAAVIGCGDISIVHLEAISSLGADLVAVADTDPELARATGARLGVPAYTDHRQLLAEVRPDVVHVCTPHDQHVSVALDAIEAGVHVITEKPLAHTIAEGERLVAAAEGAPVKVAVCLQNRYNAPNARMKELLNSGELGAVQGASAGVYWHRNAAYYEAKPWRATWARSGGGLLINQAIHTVDLLQWLLGDVEQVRGHAATHVLGDAIEVEDTAELILDHSGGARSVMFATNAHSVNAPVFVEVLTERATLTMRGDLRVQYTDGRTEHVAERVATSSGRAYWGISHELLIGDFYDKLDDPEPFWISPAEAAKSLAILKSIYAQSPNLGAPAESVALPVGAR